MRIYYTLVAVVVLWGSVDQLKATEVTGGTGTYNDPYYYKLYATQNSFGFVLVRGQTAQTQCDPPVDSDGDGMQETTCEYTLDQEDSKVITKIHPLGFGTELVKSKTGYRKNLIREYTTENLAIVSDQWQKYHKIHRSAELANAQALTWTDEQRTTCTKQALSGLGVISKSTVHCELTKFAAVVPGIVVPDGSAEIDFEFKHYESPGSGEGDDYEPPMEHVAIYVWASDWNGNLYCEMVDNNNGPSASGPQIGSECDQLTSQGFLNYLLLNPWDHFYDEQLPVSSYIEEFSQEFLRAILPQNWA